MECRKGKCGFICWLCMYFLVSVLFPSLTCWLSTFKVASVGWCRGSMLWPPTLGKTTQSVCVLVMVLPISSLLPLTVVLGVIIFFNTFIWVSVPQYYKIYFPFLQWEFQYMSLFLIESSSYVFIHSLAIASRDKCIWFLF